MEVQPTGGLLKGMADVLHPKDCPPAQHGALATYLPPSSPLPSCLSLSCSSLAPLCRVLPEPLDLATTRDTPALARHFLLQLQTRDQERGARPGHLGYAAMFQYYLDFFALAVKAEGQEECPTFPASPREGVSYQSKACDWSNGEWEGWRGLEEVQASLQLPYWQSHPLQGQGWQCYPEDKVLWQEVGKVLGLAPVGRGEVTLLAKAMVTTCAKLDSLHRVFHGGLREKKEGMSRRKCSVM